MTVRWLSHDEWEQLAVVAGAHPHQLPAYSRAMGIGEQAYGMISLDEAGGMLLPLWEREPGVVASVYGYGGPLHWGTGVGRHLEVLLDTIRDEGAMTLFLRTCPPRRLPADAFEVLRASGATMMDHSPSVEVRITDQDQMWAGLAKSMRRGVRKLIEGGYRWRVHTADHPLLGEFEAMHAERMTEFGATGAIFDRAAAVELMGDPTIECVVITIHDPKGELAAGQMFMAAGGMVDVADGGQATDHVDASPLKLADWQTLLWALDNDMHTVHLGGGRAGREDTLVRYKLALGGRPLYDCTWRLVLDAERFDKRCAEQGVAADTTGFFPPWFARPEAA